MTLFHGVLENMEKAMVRFSSGAHYDSFMEARNCYFQLTGSVHSDSDEFEAKMNSFSDWYLLDYRARAESLNLWQTFVEKEDDLRELSISYESKYYSLYEFKKYNLKKEIVLRDLFTRKNLTLPAANVDFALVEQDLFIGRLMTIKNEKFLLRGICILPNGIRSIIVKQIKRLPKGDQKARERFLMRLEELKTKWISFGKIDPNKIFIFE